MSNNLPEKNVRSAFTERLCALSGGGNVIASFKEVPCGFVSTLGNVFPSTISKLSVYIMRWHPHIGIKWTPKVSRILCSKKTADEQLLGVSFTTKIKSNLQDGE